MTSNVLAAFVKRNSNTLCISVLLHKVGNNKGLRVTAKANLEALSHLCRLVSFKAEKKKTHTKDETNS